MLGDEGRFVSNYSEMTGTNVGEMTDNVERAQVQLGGLPFHRLEPKVLYVSIKLPL